ncbi:hypothetical protein BYT27DRAFT_7334809 [Phlegmacium glaucopus]|nr:hypothetical protein BYT27DRAFT_7334809 [Phlegmacium glaucopus]
MVQITSSLLVTAAAVIPALAHLQTLARREDTDIVGSAFSRRFYDTDPIVVTRDVAVDLQERDLIDTGLHPERTWKEHRRKKAAGSAAKARVNAEIKQEHFDALGGFGNQNTRREYLDLQERDPTDTVLHPERTWNEHRRKKAAGSAARARVDAQIKQEHFDALGGFGNPNMRREYVTEYLAERSFDEFDLD